MTRDATIRDPLFTDLITDASQFTPESRSVYVSGRSAELRSQHVEDLRDRSPGTKFVDIEQQEPDRFVVHADPATQATVRLRSAEDLVGFWRTLSGYVPYLDITGLSHHVWAPLVASALRSGVALRVVYVEPLKYRRNEVADGGSELFDLSSSLGVVAPLPGFLRLTDPDETFYFVPLLGFEGRRFSLIFSEVAPAGGHTIPVVGVPGFQPEFVGFAYDGNRIPLVDSAAWQRVKFATANDPFSVFYLLESIAQEHDGAFLKVAPIGTKPHGLGAVLFALSRPDLVEIVYDHPERKDRRTAGAARLLVYHVYALAALRQFPARRS